MLYEMITKTDKLFYAKNRKAMKSMKNSAWIFKSIRPISEIQKIEGVPIFNGMDEMLNSSRPYMRKRSCTFAENKLRHANPEGKVRCDIYTYYYLDKKNFYPKNLNTGENYYHNRKIGVRGFCNCARDYHFPQFKKMGAKT